MDNKLKTQVKKLRAAGVRVRYYYVFGDPRTTIETYNSRPRKQVECRVIEPVPQVPVPKVPKQMKDENDLCNGCLLQGTKHVKCEQILADILPFSIRGEK